jgi:hypothetical protein
MTVMAQRLRSWNPFKRAHGQRVRCPNDNWTFAPGYTDGVCPLDGWKPEGLTFERPYAARIDWFVPSVIFLAVVSVLMGILAFMAYNR